jgi:hypothetical protein
MKENRLGCSFQFLKRQHTCVLGSSDFDKYFLKIAMLHVVLDWQKRDVRLFLKRHFLYFVVFLPFLVLVSKNLKNGPSEVKISLK